MKLKIKKVINFTAAILLTALSLTGCQKKLPQHDDSDSIEINVKEIPEQGNPELKQAQDFSGKICVLFGFGFNSSEYVNEALDMLNETVGMEDSDSIIMKVVYPEDLKNHIMNLREMLNSQDIKGLILLGAPESTHNLLRNLELYWDGPVPYPVFSFFPQDNIAGQEAYCNFVLDYEPVAESSSEEIKKEFDAKLKDISLSLLKDSVQCMIDLQAPLNWDKDLLPHVKYITGMDSVKRYRDASTGIAATNHFVIKILETEDNTQKSLFTGDDGTPLSEEEQDAALLKFMEEN